tara:strand:- start:1172 stop:1411 length:240 start_codon:yes stop_codon:yes gene_type:complete
MENQLEKLQDAFDKMKEAEEIIEELRKDKDSSLDEYYGYSLEIIEAQLNQFSDNSVGYVGMNTNLKEIIDSEGENWNEK